MPKGEKIGGPSSAKYLGASGPPVPASLNMVHIQQRYLHLPASNIQQNYATPQVHMTHRIFFQIAHLHLLTYLRFSIEGNTRLLIFRNFSILPAFFPVINEKESTLTAVFHAINANLNRQVEKMWKRGPYELLLCTSWHFKFTKIRPPLKRLGFIIIELKPTCYHSIQVYIYQDINRTVKPRQLLFCFGWTLGRN